MGREDGGAGYGYMEGSRRGDGSGGEEGGGGVRDEKIRVNEVNRATWKLSKIGTETSSPLDYDPGWNFSTRI